MKKQVATQGLLQLLGSVVTERTDLDLNLFDAATAQLALDRGLGPLLFRATKNNPLSAASPLQPLLHSADLTSRILVHEQLDGLREILNALGHSAHHVTLLKGISICQTHYPEPQLRLMGDIDLLVLDEQNRNALEMQLHELGYRQQSHCPEEFYCELHHHSMPFFHPHRKIWVEVHNRLFPPSSTVAQDKIFSLDHIASQTLPREFLGAPCTQLTNEMQLVYTSCHWAEEFNTSRGLVPMLDVLYLLTRSPQKIDWDQILSWLPGTAAAAHLYLMVSYLQHHGLITIPEEVEKNLRALAASLNDLTCSFLWRQIDVFLIKGQAYGRIATEANVGIIWNTLLSHGAPAKNLLSIPLNLAFPPRNPHRLSPAFQFSRIAAALGLRR
jgi:hypothetical protein